MTREERETRFSVVYAKWWDSRQISRSRRYTDEGRARLHVLPYWGHWRICDIRPSDIDDWIAGLSTKMKGDSVRACYGLLRGPLRRAVRDRLIIDPCVEIRLPKKPDRRKSFDDVLTAGELMALADGLVDDNPRYAGLKTNGRYRAMIVAGGWLGPRWNEILGVRRGDLNPLHAEIAFGRVVINQNGAQLYEKRGSKTDDHRIVPVPAMVLDELNRHIATYCPDAGPREFIFTTRNRHASSAVELLPRRDPRRGETRRARRPADHLAHLAAHRVADVRRRTHHLRRAAAARAPLAGDHPGGVHAPDAPPVRDR